MSPIGHVRTARQFYVMAYEPLIMAEAHAMASCPLREAEVLDAVANLCRAADALEAALKVVRFPPQRRFEPAPRPFVGAGEALKGVDAIGKLFAPDALVGFPTINNDLPSDCEPGGHGDPAA